MFLSLLECKGLRNLLALPLLGLMRLGLATNLHILLGNGCAVALVVAMRMRFLVGGRKLSRVGSESCITGEVLLVVSGVGRDSYIRDSLPIGRL